MTDLSPYFEQAAAEAGNVLRSDFDYSCEFCLGPKSSPDFSYCIGCDRLLGSGDVPTALYGAVVPMTSAVQPGPWYNRLLQYKTAEKAWGWLVAAVVRKYLTDHAADVTALLSGTPDYVTVVPSKKAGTTFETQTLRRVLTVACDGIHSVVETLRYEPQGTWNRQRYQPESFRGTGDVRGDRVILIEDTWTSGATATSAAGALLRDGAQAVAVLPIARQIATAFHGEEHPYILVAKPPYRVEIFPRIR